MEMLIILIEKALTTSHSEEDMYNLWLQAPQPPYNTSSFFSGSNIASGKPTKMVDISFVFTRCESMNGGNVSFNESW